MASTSTAQTFPASTRTVVAPLPRPALGDTILRAARRVRDLLRDEPPDVPGAVGASDVELLRLGRTPRVTGVPDRMDDAFRLYQHGSHLH